MDYNGTDVGYTEGGKVLGRIGEGRDIGKVAVFLAPRIQRCDESGVVRRRRRQRRISDLI